MSFGIFIKETLANVCLHFGENSVENKHSNVTFKNFS